MCAKKKNSSLKKKIGIGVAVAGAAAGAVAAGVAAYRHSKSEQVYHEAELKAMSELDDLNAENAACEGCEEAEETGASIRGADEHGRCRAGSSGRRSTGNR